MERMRSNLRCACCGMRPVWFGCVSWCACEPPPPGTRLCGEIHECSAERRLHRHSFTRVAVEEDWTGLRMGVVFACRCGQARRLDPDG